MSAAPGLACKGISPMYALAHPWPTSNSDARIEWKVESPSGRVGDVPIHGSKDPKETLKRLVARDARDVNVTDRARFSDQLRTAPQGTRHISSSLDGAGARSTQRVARRVSDTNAAQ
jgi:hypothetical protein